MAAGNTGDNNTIEYRDSRDARQFLAVRAGELQICIELECVERTFSLVALQPVPGGAHFVAGIMNHAGVSLPVIDLALRLALPSAPYSLDTPIVMCRQGDRRVGVIVSDIIGIQSLNRREIQLARELEQHGAAFRASLHTSAGLAFLLDSAWLTEFSLYDSPEQEKNEAGVLPA